MYPSEQPLERSYACTTIFQTFIGPNPFLQIKKDKLVLLFPPALQDRGIGFGASCMGVQQLPPALADCANLCVHAGTHNSWALRTHAETSALDNAQTLTLHVALREFTASGPAARTLHWALPAPPDLASLHTQNSNSQSKR